MLSANDVNQVQHPKIVDTFINPPTIVKKENKTTVYEGRMANYKSMTIIELPNEVSDQLMSWNDGVRATKLGLDVWELSRKHGPYAQKPHAFRGLSIGKLGLRFSHNPEIEGLFGMSRAEFVFVDDKLLVSVPKPTPIMKEFSDRGKGAWKNRRASLAQSVNKSNAATEPVTPVWVPERKVMLTSATEDDMRAILNMLKQVEELTPYRLRKEKDTGAWVFSAPVIKG